MARSFNGSSDEISMGSPAILTTGLTAVTLSCWANTTSLASTYENIAGSADGSGGNYQILIKSTGKVAYYILSSNATIDIDPGTATVSTNVWNQFALTYDSVGGLKTFFNAVSDGTQAANGGLKPTVRAFVAGWQATLSRFFTGSIAEVGVWSVSLTSSEIISLSKGARPYTVRPGSLVGYWPFDGISSPEPDLSGNANNGTLTGTALSFGAPLMQFTPRWPQANNAAIPVVAFKPQFALGRNVVVEGVAT